MIKETKTTKQVTVTEKRCYCDDCGKEIHKMYSSNTCQYCGKDICRNCIGYEDDSLGDYSDVYCKKCWEIGTDYRVQIEKLEEDIEKLYEEWQNKCKTK